MAIAQVPDTTPMPRDLYLALTTRFDVPRTIPTLVVGALPAQDMGVAVPAMATVLGGVVRRTRRGVLGGGTVALLMPGTAAESQQLTMDHLNGAGFRRVPLEPGPTEGFVGGVPEGLDWNVFCRDSTQLDFTSRPRAAGGSYVVLQFVRVGENSRCSASWVGNRVSLSSGPEPELRFPAMNAPDEATGIPSMQSGWGPNEHSRVTGARITSDLTAEAILAHYTSELEKQGWKAVTNARNAPVLAQLLRQESPNYVREILLTNFRTSDGTHHVTAQLFSTHRIR